MKMNITDKNSARQLLLTTQNELAELKRMFSRMDILNDSCLSDLEVSEVMQDYCQLACNRLQGIKALLIHRDKTETRQQNNRDLASHQFKNIPIPNKK